MGAFEEIHCLEDFGMIAGGYKVIYIDCTDNVGNPIDLTDASSFGCRFYYYGTTDLVFSISGTVSAQRSYRMKIELSSEITQDIGECCLEYVPYVVFGNEVIKYGKGRIVIEEE